MPALRDGGGRGGNGYPGFHPGLFSFAPYGRTSGWFDWLRGKGEGHLTRINDILANLMEAESCTGSGR
jgi:hypothetical protein